MIKSALSLKTLTILGVALILPLSALAQTAKKSDSILEASTTDPSVHIDLGILDALTTPNKQTTKPKVQPPKKTPAKKATPQQKTQSIKGLQKSRAIKDQEKALDALEQKYFPERYAEKFKKRKAAEQAAQETQAKQVKIARKKKEQKRWNKRRIAARKSMPTPALKPQANRTAIQHKAKTIQKAKTAATPKAPAPKVIDLTAKPARSTKSSTNAAVQQPARQLDLTSKPKKAAPISATSNKTAQGKKLVSIAYVDKEININANVQNALKSNYVQKMIEKRTKHIGLYSYATTTNKTQEQALDFAKKRAKSLKRFLVNAGVRSDMIEIHTKVTNDSNNFSDWIDIIQQK